MPTTKMLAEVRAGDRILTETFTPGRVHREALVVSSASLYLQTITFTDGSSVVVADPTVPIEMVD